MALIDPDPQIIPGVKLGLHSFQIIFSFVLWCLEIAVFRGDDAKIVGLNGWTFGVCFISAPAWVFLIMTPRFGRTRKFANPYAMFAVDGAMFLIWISAFATQAAYNSANLCGKVCGLSKGIVGIGVFVSLLWLASTLVSAYTMQYYNFHNTLPGYDNRKIGGENIDPDKAAFSMAPVDEEAYERVNMDDHENDAPGSRYDDPASRYGDANPYSADDFDDPNRYGARPPRQTTSLFDSETEYNPGAGAGSSLGLGLSGHNKSPSPKPTSYEDEPIQFPSGNYDRIQH
ncbi:hypothetical protein PT974_07065 [Cladobotryum mycophilum]|uniref:MARVEL domain-containing protein n=1 Tax=Cladobotryum mycophilum TaxID=491253 RepID=A0ABR0SPD7_9HYPO